MVDDINEASRTARALDYRNRVVTVDGQVVNAGGSFTSGSVSRSIAVQPQTEIDELKKKVGRWKSSGTPRRKKTDRAKAEVDALSAELTATESEAITARGDKIRGEVESGRIAAALSQARAAGKCFPPSAPSAAQIAASEKAGADAAAEMEVLTRRQRRAEENCAPSPAATTPSWKRARALRTSFPT